MKTGLKYVVLLALTATSVLAAPDPGRLPPSTSAAQVRSLFAAERYEAAFAQAIALYEWGDTSLHYEIAYMLDHGLGTPVDRKLALSHYRAAADAGNVLAMYATAMMYGLGEVVPRDPDRQCDWFERAAAKDHLESVRGLAHCYGEGRGRPADAAHMLTLLHRAAARGHAGALHDLLHFYRRPDRARHRPSDDYAQAVQAALHGRLDAARQFARRAIEAGDYRAYGPLGDVWRQTGDADTADLMLELGRGFGSVMADYATAQLHLDKGATATGCRLHLDAFRRGFSQSGVEAGRCYARAALPSDTPQRSACQLFEQASAQGNAQAHIELARCTLQDSQHGEQAVAALRLFADGVQQDPGVADPDLERQLCALLPRLDVNTDLTPGAGWSGPAPLQPGDAVCVEADDGSMVMGYVPRLRWNGLIPASALAPVSLRIAGLALDDLTREAVRAEAAVTVPTLLPLQLSPDEDRFWLTQTSDAAVRFHYDDSARVIAAQQVTSYVFDRERFRERVLELSAAAGATEQLDDAGPLIASARWSSPRWNMTLVYDATRAELREDIRRSGLSDSAR